MKAWLNGKLIEENQASLSIFDRSYLYGEGVFETLRCYQGKPAFLARHLKRLKKNCEELSIPCSNSEREWSAIIGELLQANQLKEAVCRMTLSTEGATFGVDRPKNPKANLSIFCRPPTLDPNLFQVGVKVLAQTNLVNDSPKTAHIKSTSYLIKMLARAEAAKAQAYETLLKNTHGFWVEGSRTNLFIVLNKTVLTAPLEDGILDGITREVVLEILKGKNIPHREEHITDAMLKNSEEVFLTGSTSEVMPVNEVIWVWKKAISKEGLTFQLQSEYQKRSMAE